MQGSDAKTIFPYHFFVCSLIHSLIHSFIHLFIVISIYAAIVCISPKLYNIARRMKTKKKEVEIFTWQKYPFHKNRPIGKLFSIKLFILQQSYSRLQIGQNPEKFVLFTHKKMSNEKKRITKIKWFR